MPRPTHTMNLTREHLHLAYSAWSAALNNGGIVVHDTAYPEADDLAEMGWLERRFQPDGEMSWHWTHQADTALAISGLLDQQSPN